MRRPDCIAEELAILRRTAGYPPAVVLSSAAKLSPESLDYACELGNDIARHVRETEAGIVTSLSLVAAALGYLVGSNFEQGRPGAGEALEYTIEILTNALRHSAEGGFADKRKEDNDRRNNA